MIGPWYRHMIVSSDGRQRRSEVRETRSARAPLRYRRAPMGKGWRILTWRAGKAGEAAGSWVSFTFGAL